MKLVDLTKICNFIDTFTTLVTLASELTSLLIIEPEIIEIYAIIFISKLALTLETANRLKDKVTEKKVKHHKQK